MSIWGRERQVEGPDIENVPSGFEARQKGWVAAAEWAWKDKEMEKEDGRLDQAGCVGLCMEFIVYSGKGTTGTFWAEWHGLTYVLTGSLWLRREEK